MSRGGYTDSTDQAQGTRLQKDGLNHVVADQLEVRFSLETKGVDGPVITDRKSPLLPQVSPPSSAAKAAVLKTHQMALYVLVAPGEKVVEHDDLQRHTCQHEARRVRASKVPYTRRDGPPEIAHMVASRHQVVDEMRAKEASSAGHCEVRRSEKRCS